MQGVDFVVPLTEFIFQLVHFVNRDSWGLANDFLSLGFVPDGADLKTVADALQASFGDGARQLTDFQVCITILFPDIWSSFRRPLTFLADDHGSIERCNIV